MKSMQDFWNLNDNLLNDNKELRIQIMINEINKLLKNWIRAKLQLLSTGKILGYKLALGFGNIYLGI